MNYQEIDQLIKQGNLEEGFKALVSLYNKGDKSKQVVINIMNIIFNTQPPQVLESFVNETYEMYRHDLDYKYILGSHYLKINKIEEAEKIYLDIKNKFKDNTTFLTNLGSINLALGKKDFAKSWYEKALKIDPKFTPALFMLATLYDSETNYEKAMECYKTATEINPNDSGSLNNLGNIYKNAGLLHNSVECYEKAIKINPKGMMLWTNLLLATYNITEDYGHINKRFKANFPAKNIDRSFFNISDSTRRLRIGFISPDFKQHSVAYFTLPLFKNYNRDKYEFYIYADNPNEDDTTKQFKANCDLYTRTSDMSDEDLATLIEKHQIDIMVDLALVSGYNRLGLFKDLIAPIQVSWLGANGSVSLESMGGRLMSSHLISEKEKSLSEEPLIDLGSTFFTFENDEVPIRKYSPFDRNGYITFSCFAYPAKLSVECVEFYSKILKAIPESKIIFKYKSFESDLTKKVLLNKFKPFGDFESRLEIRGFTKSHLENYLECDLTLDSFPYNGTTTLMDSIVTATPFFALIGETANSLQGYNIAKNLDLEDRSYSNVFVAKTQKELIDKIVTFSKKPDEIRWWHQNLRNIFLKSALSDHKAFANTFCETLRGLWINYCNSL